VKYARIIGLAAVAAMVLTATVGASSASASVETTLCKTNTEYSHCASGNRYASETAISASASSSVTFASSVFGVKFDVVCGESQIEGHTSSAQGSPQPIYVSKVEFQKCVFNGGESCTVATTNLGHSGSLEWNGTQNGKATLGSTTVNIQCPGIPVCEFTGAPGGTLTGGNPASLAIAETSLSKTSGGFPCPATATLKPATYTVNAPKPAYVALAAAPTTGFCKAEEAVCKPENAYPKGTSIAAEAYYFQLSAPISYLGELSCKKATVSASSEALYAEPLPLAVSTSFNECYWSKNNPEKCTVSSSGFFSSVSHKAGTVDGTLAGQGKLTIECPGLPTCGYTVAKEAEQRFTGGGISPQFVIAAAPLENPSPSIVCPEKAKLTALFEVSSPKPLYVSDIAH
jgi:hypothetical protein